MRRAIHESRFPKRLRAVSAIALMMSVGGFGLACGDVVKLKESGEIRGVVRTSTSTPNGLVKAQVAKNGPPNDVTNDAVTIETLTGATITLDADQVAFVTRRPRILEEYESQDRHAANTVEARWQLAEWCREHGLKEPRQQQLERILELDPEHKQAHYGMGHRRQDNRWIDPREEEAALLASGYVRHKGRVMTLLERDQLEVGEQRRQEQNAWRPKIRLWLGWLNGRDARKQSEAIVNFRELRDADAVPAVVDFLLTDSKVELRRSAVQVLAQIGGASTVVPLARVALTESDHLLADTAFDAIDKQHRLASESLFLKGLKDESNFVVRRAAVLLARIGNRSAIPALIEALVTSHKTQVAIQPGISTGFNRDGSQTGTGVLPLEIEGALRAGQLPYGVQVRDGRPPPPVKWVTVRQAVQNPEVLEALRKLAQEDFSFDERAWRLWWQSQSK